ncbi:MAG: tetratricopeptide repeat protein [Gammaproteobacteria bacterium]|nr:tetratricopeptide repeat protein [Gammaproteobacteria bacterium]
MTDVDHVVEVHRGAHLMRMMRTVLPWLLAGSLAVGCAVPLRDQEPVDRQPEPARPAPDPDRTAPASTRPAAPESPAVVELSARAREALDDSRHDDALQLLERAIRIEPQNGALWHQLARVRFQQGNYEQARQLATRSNALLTGNSRLRASNDELIEAARDAESF